MNTFASEDLKTKPLTLTFLTAKKFNQKSMEKDKEIERFL